MKKIHASLLISSHLDTLQTTTILEDDNN